MAEYVELYIDQGADYSTSISIDDDNTNLPVNVASYIVTAGLKRSLLSQNLTASFNCSISIETNEIILSLPGDVSANIRPGSYFYKVEVVDTDYNTSSRLIEGMAIIAP